ncbi:hypothetical protein HY383_04060 [Candidatus Daviesbacteria bacterium]|nr:hypothetical protein [Candidatus Daviesbacteria bacterium]
MNNTQDPNSSNISTLPKETLPNSTQIEPGYQIDPVTSSESTEGSINNFQKPAPKSLEEVRAYIKNLTTNPIAPITVGGSNSIPYEKPQGLTKQQLAEQVRNRKP